MNADMLSLILLYGIFGGFSFSCAEICGPCICQDSLAICYITDCHSVLVKSPDVEILRIYGELCETHVIALQDDYYHNTIVELMDSLCKENINNCR